LFIKFLNLSAELRSMVDVDAVEEEVDEEDKPGLVLDDLLNFFLSEGRAPP
jgi:hypothetical protein